MKKINVGLSIMAAEGLHIWSNGLNQNLAFLVDLFRRVPSVGKVFLLNGGNVDQLPATLGFDEVDAPLVRPQDVTHEVDLVIEMGATLPLEWLRHVRALGAKVVAYYVGHTYLSQAETSVFAKDGFGAAYASTPWDEIWTLESFMKTSGPMMRTLARVPVHAAPHIWSPHFLQRHIDEQSKQGKHFGFDAKRARGTPGWRVAIFEPNISVGKNCFIPMLACDQAYRLNRDSVSLMMVMNSFHMKEHATFNRLASHLDLTRDGKASYEPRMPFVECMTGQSMDAVVAHQWEWGLNYVYYDALHGGYPLVHNSEQLHAAGAGLYYPRFEAARAGEVLAEAWSRPPEFWSEYARKSRDFVRGLAPDAPANIEAYARMITSLLGDRLGRSE